MSGERQEGSSVSMIRKDHVNRYEFVAEYLKDANNLVGIDCFCGNGYGSNILASKLRGSQITSYDASRGAIRSAKEFYRRKNIKFIRDSYPFEIKSSHYDFAVSLESIEHVEMYEDLLANLISSLKENGLLFISVPNEDKIPHHLNRNPYHVKHFMKNEVEDLVRNNGGEIVDMYGQDCYIVEDKIIKGTISPDEMDLHKDHDGQFLIFVIKIN
jgi:2-polyprenyl-3-methyl-5-hydroxy-6-metoxy-1,4-benzoquinol methylase